jgi:hypothetical protein
MIPQNEYVRIGDMWHILETNIRSKHLTTTRCGVRVTWLSQWNRIFPESVTTFHVDAVCHAHVIPDIACVSCAMTEFREE